jgi:uncharacterized phage infection (PIP) family protein YhgE
MKIIIEQSKETNSLELRDKLLNILKKTVYRKNPSVAADFLEEFDRRVAATGGDKGGHNQLKTIADSLKKTYATAHKELQATVRNKLQPNLKSDSTKADPIPRELVEEFCKLYIELKETRDQAKDLEVSLTEIPKGANESPPLKRKYWNIVSRITKLRETGSTFQKIPADKSIFKERYLHHERHSSKFAPIYDAYNAWLKAGNEPIQGIDTEKLKRAFDS